MRCARTVCRSSSPCVCQRSVLRGITRGWMVRRPVCGAAWADSPCDLSVRMLGRTEARSAAATAWRRRWSNWMEHRAWIEDRAEHRGLPLPLGSSAWLAACSRTTVPTAVTLRSSERITPVCEGVRVSSECAFPCLLSRVSVDRRDRRLCSCNLEDGGAIQITRKVGHVSLLYRGFIKLSVLVTLL